MMISLYYRAVLCGCKNHLKLPLASWRWALWSQRSHAPAALAPDLLEPAKAGHCRPLQRRPVLHPVPIAHGGFPVKAPVIWDVMQEQTLHLPGELGPLLDLKRPTL